MKSQRRRRSTQKLQKSRSIRNNRNFADGLARRAQEAARLRNLKEVYETTKRLSGKYQEEEKPIKGKQGNSLNTVEEHLSDGLSTLANY